MSSKETLIEKLNLLNYSLWKFKIQMLLMKEDLLKCIEEALSSEINVEWEKKMMKRREP